MIVVPAKVMHTFCQYCGAFAAARLFVEIAIPTAMALCSTRLQSIDNLLMKRYLIFPRPDEQNILTACNYSYNKLVEEFPKDMLYIHPVKLSQWK